MAKSSAKKPAKQNPLAGSRKTAGQRSKAGEFVNCLMELHKLQGVLLKELHKEV